MIDFTLEQTAIFDADLVFMTDEGWDDGAFDACMEHAHLNDIDNGFTVYLMNDNVEEKKEWFTYLAELRLDEIPEEFIEALESARQAGAKWASFLVAN